MADQTYTFPIQWTPPPDPDRPDCPYMPGFKVQLTSHTPPPPVGGRYYPSGRRPEVTREWLKKATQSEHPEAAELTITKTIAIGNARGAQLVVCNVTPQDNRKPFLATAKIFDALYYPFCDKLVNVPVDVVQTADTDYSREAAAYKYIRTVCSTSFTADYFDSWTFSLPITRQGIVQQRPVRLVLIEHLEGSSIRDLYAPNSSGSSAELDAFHYKEDYRLEVLAQIMDGVMKQLHVGLVQRDLAPRNVILVPQPPADHGPDRLPRVILVDYNTSIVYPITKLGKHACQDLERPLNPIEAYWTESLPDFAGWIPPEWYENPRRRQEWLIRRFGGDKLSLYDPISEDLQFTQLD